MHEVFFVSQEKKINVSTGTSLLDAAHQAGILLESPCNREGICGKCKVAVDGDSHSSLRDGQGDHLLRTVEEGDDWVLGCQVYIYGDIRVVVQPSEQSMTAIVADGKCCLVPLHPMIVKEYEPLSGTTRVMAGGLLLETETGDTTDSLYGVAIDIGTTTLVVALVDLATGKEVASTSALNPQALHAQDVLSRIKLGSAKDGLILLQTELFRELNRMIALLSAGENRNRSHIYEAILSGNTTMLTIAAKTSPSSLGKSPYQVQVQTDCSLPAVELGLQIAEKGIVWFPPVASAYVGADIISGIIAADLLHLAGITLFVDIGTNGEMLIAADGKITATSTAAGPAFEGMNISCGMRAVDGAIEKVHLKGGTVEIQTISGALPIGLCGSGLLDVVGEMAREGIVDRNGRFAKPGTEVFEVWRDYIDVIEGRTRFRLSEKVSVTQQDIRQVQLAKGAVRAGVDLLLKKTQLAAEDVDRVFIAGSFGAHLQVSSLIFLGLLPESFADRVEFLGNTSRSGATAFLLNQKMRREASALVKRMTVLELSGEPEFDKIFLQALAFPQAAVNKKEDVYGV